MLTLSRNRGDCSQGKISLPGIRQSHKNRNITSNTCKLADYGVSIMSHGEKQLWIFVWKISGVSRRRIEHDEKQNISFLHCVCVKSPVLQFLLHRIRFSSKWKRCACYKHHILQQIKLEESRVLKKEKPWLTSLSDVKLFHFYYLWFCVVHTYFHLFDKNTYQYDCLNLFNPLSLNFYF